MSTQPGPTWSNHRPFAPNFHALTTNTSGPPTKGIYEPHTYDESERGIREIFVPFQGDF